MTTSRDPRGGFAADLALLGATAVWGVSFLVVRSTLAEVSPLLFVALRFTVATLVLTPLVLGRQRSMARTLGGAGSAATRARRPGILVGLWLVLGFGLQTIGLETTEPARAAFLTGLTVVLVPILSVAFYRRIPKIGSLAGVALATAGLALLTGPRGGGFSSGDAFVLLGAAAFAFQILAVGRYASDVGAADLLVWEVATAAAVAWPAALLLEQRRWPVHLLAWCGILGAALFATLLCLGIQNWAQKRTPPTRAAVILSAEPVFAALASYLLTSERLGGAGLAGCGLILSGMLVAEWGRFPNRPFGDTFP